MRQPPQRPHQRPATARATAALAGALLVCACTAVKHGYTADEYAGRTLPVASAAGSERLALELEYDAAVRDCVQSHGRPAYLHVVDRKHLYLFYPERDLVAVIKRDLTPPGEIVEYTRIPGHFLTMLPAAEFDRIQARRAAQERRRPAARRSRAIAPPPAAPAPRSAGLSLSGFDLDTMIERFREPMTAADAGVTRWRIAELADGSRAGIARSGSTEYRIQPDAVTAATRLPGRSRSAPPEAKLSYQRVNRAVFGTRAQAISRKVEPFVAQVAADPSGNTHILRRIAGRTVSVSRDARQGLLVYRVRAD